jgi:hypothetical protein
MDFDRGSERLITDNDTEQSRFTSENIITAENTHVGKFFFCVNKWSGYMSGKFGNENFGGKARGSSAQGELNVVGGKKFGKTVGDLLGKRGGLWNGGAGVSFFGG